MVSDYVTYARPDNYIAGKMCGVTVLLLTLQMSGIVTRHLGILPSILFCAGILVRIFIIFHDIGHHSFSRFDSRLVRVASFLSMTPKAWVVNHRLHHNNGNDLVQNVSTWNDTVFYTLSQYEALPHWSRIVHRIWRDPIIFFFLLGPLNQMIGNKLEHWSSELEASLGLVFYILVAFLFDNIRGVWVFIFGFYLASVIGMLLFHSQHVQLGKYVMQPLRNLSGSGSSFLQIPWWLQWVTIGIEYHHIHHHHTGIPCYHLRACHIAGESKRLWDNVYRMPIFDIWRVFRLTLYDDKTMSFVPFPSK
jgi:omega-6 fatty acid desaturase (delta-12 desaturase)